MFLKKWPPVAILDVQKSLCIAFLTISDQYHNFYFCEVFLQIGCRRPFWMSENHFRSHFWQFQTNMQLFFKFVFTKWLPSAILDVRNSLWITFLAILDQYRFFLIFYFFYKMAAGGHFGCPKITFDLISGHFRSIHNFNLFWNFWQNGCRQPFWMSEFHFRSHFWPFQIDMQLYFFWKFLTKWLTSAILDVRNSSSITFWPFQIDRPFWISEIHIQSQFWPFQIDTELFFSGGHFGCLKITLDRISGHFRLIGHFECPKFTFDGISGHFRSIRNFFLNFWQNGHWRPFWMSANNFRSHFWPFQIDTQFFFGWDDNVNYWNRPRYLDE